MNWRKAKKKMKKSFGIMKINIPKVKKDRRKNKVKSKITNWL